MRVADLIKESIWIPGASYDKYRPTVTVIMPTYRRGANGYFKRAAESVLAQTMKDIELIIIDDGSTDGTADVIEQLMGRDPRVSCIRHPRNVGLPALSLFEGFAKSRADILMFAFDDNDLYPTALESLHSHLERLNKSVVYGHVKMHFFNGSDSRGIMDLGSGQEPLTTLFSHNFIPNNGVMARREVFERVGWYDPHIMMIRSCDWDLWKRISRHYDLCGVDVEVGIEYGPVLSDSLGIAYPMSEWAFEEWCRLPGRQERLLPDRLLDYEVDSIPPGASEYLRQVIRETEVFLRFLSWSTEPSETREMPGVALIVATDIDAHVSLSFEGLPWQAQQRLRVIRGDRCWEQIAGASCVVFVRHLFFFQEHHWLARCRDLGVPHYLFLDDNLFELAREDPEYADWELDTVRSMLSSFSGLLISSQTLLDFCRDNELHPCLHYYPPVRQSVDCYEPAYQEDNGEIRIAFLGGSHRHEPFLKWVLPAIRDLSQAYKIRLWLAGFEKELVESYRSNNLTIECLPHYVAYHSLMLDLDKRNIDIIVHPSSHTVNNPYKTCNVVLNADTLNAATVVSDRAPYNALPGLEKCVVMCRDSMDQWREGIARVIEDKDYRRQLIENMNRYCDENHNGKINREVIERMLNRHPFPGFMMRESRFLAALQTQERLWQQAYQNLQARIEKSPVESTGPVPLTGLTLRDRLLTPMQSNERLWMWYLRNRERGVLLMARRLISS